MIAERIPEISKLTLQEKRELMNELWEDIHEAENQSPDPNIIKLVEERLAHYEKFPETAVTLEEFRRRLGSS